jgi:hypothetical protein
MTDTDNKMRKQKIVNVPVLCVPDDAVERTVNGTRKVALKKLKEFVAVKMPRSSLIREIILTDSEDELGAQEFLGRVYVWLQLLRRPEFLSVEGRTSRSVLGGKNFERETENAD